MILKHKDISDKILKAFFNVYNTLGRGFLESVYEKSMIIELNNLGLKAVTSIIKEHEAQLMNYLKATKIEVGLLLNFGEKPEIKRFDNDNSRKTNIPMIIEDNHK